MSGGLGCGAFIVGSLLAALLFAPSLLGGSAARFLESAFGGDLDGRIELDRVNIAWNEKQELSGLRLYDPAGEEVLSGHLTIPGLLAWDVSGKPLPIRLELNEVLMRRGADGVSGLARALGAGGVPWPATELDWTFGEFDVSRGLDQTFPYEFLWTVDQLRLVDDLRPDFVLRLADLRGRAVRNLEGDLWGRVSGVAVLDGVEGAFEWDWARSSEGDATGTLEADGMPTGALLEWNAGLCHLPLLCGEQVDLKLELETQEQELPTRITGTLLGEVGQVEIDLQRTGDTLELGEDGALEFQSRMTADFVEQVGADVAGLSVGEAQWTASATRLEWPIPAAQAAERNFLFEGEVLGPCRLGTNPEAAALLDSVNFALEQRPDRPRVLSAQGRFADGDVDLRVEGPAGCCLPLRGAEDRYTLTGTGWSASGLDALLEAQGLVAEMAAGPVDVRLTGPAGKAPDGEHVLELTGEVLRLPPLRIRNGLVHLTTDPESPVVLPMGPRVCAGVLEPALPLLVRTEPGEATMLVHATELRFQLADGRLQFHSGELELAPGQVRFALHPGLSGLFSDTPEPEPEPQELLPIRVQIETDKLTYLDLDLPLAGEDCDLSGGVIQRLTGELDFPIRATLLVAAHQLQLAPQARALIEDSDYVVEMQIAGPLSEPDLRFSAGVLAEFMNGGVRRLLRDMPLPMVESGLQKLLHGAEDR